MWSLTVCCSPTAPPPPPQHNGCKHQLLAPETGRKPHLLSSSDVTTTVAPRLISSSLPSSSHRLVKSLSASGNIDGALAVLLQSPPYDPSSCRQILHACISRRSLLHGKRLHNHLLSAAPHVLCHPDVGSKLITLYAVCGRLDSAREMFDTLASLAGPGGPSLSDWTALTIAYSRNGLRDQSLVVFSEMVRRGVLPNNIAFCTALKACADLCELHLGRAIHGMMVKLEHHEQPDQVLKNSLMTFYLQCRCIEEALQVFRKMPARNVVAWNALLSGLCKQGRLVESLEVFRRMQQCVTTKGGNIGFTWVTLTTMLWACTQLTALSNGKEVHTQITKARGDEPDVPVMNALMDMYSKCGEEVRLVRRVFELMPQRNLMSWNVLLNAYAINGSAGDVLKTFHEMVHDGGVTPDEVTFLAVLSGCSRGGFVEEGRVLFDRMSADFGISPKVEHYACLVDLLGRSGKLREAVQVVNRMPMEPGGSIWGSLLNSSRIHGNIELAKKAAHKLFQLEPNKAVNYIVLSNMYAKLRMWDEANQLRDMMEAKGIRKEVSCSWIQIGSETRAFVAGGSVSLRNSPEYKAVWQDLMENMKAKGYTPAMDVVFHDVDEETKYAWLCGHSERIALVFGLMNTGHGMPIRIMKNLRVCVDCHNVMKMASDVTGRLIVLRDTNRFHHFRDGVCSCNDFW